MPARTAVSLQQLWYADGSGRSEDPHPRTMGYPSSNIAVRLQFIAYVTSSTSTPDPSPRHASDAWPFLAKLNLDWVPMSLYWSLILPAFAASSRTVFRDSLLIKYGSKHSIKHPCTENNVTTIRPTMSEVLSRSEAWSLLSLAFACFGTLANTFHGAGEPLVASLAFSGLAYSATYALIRWLGPTFIRAGLKGKDMSKPIKKEMCCCSTSTAPVTVSLTWFAVPRPWVRWQPRSTF